MAGAGSAVLAQETDAPDWTRAAAKSGQFSIETPCSAAEIEALIARRGGPVAPASDGRVMCLHRGVMFTAIVRTAPLPEGYDGPGAFDMMLAMGKSEIEASETIAVDEIDGRRSISNEELDEGRLARTVVIELSPNSLLMLVSGGPFEPGYEVEEISPMLDRFVNSLEITE